MLAGLADQSGRQRQLLVRDDNSAQRAVFWPLSAFLSIGEEEDTRETTGLPEYWNRGAKVETSRVGKSTDRPTEAACLKGSARRDGTRGSMAGGFGTPSRKPSSAPAPLRALFRFASLAGPRCFRMIGNARSMAFVLVLWNPPSFLSPPGPTSSLLKGPGFDRTYSG